MEDIAYVLDEIIASVQFDERQTALELFETMQAIVIDGQVGQSGQLADRCFVDVGDHVLRHVQTAQTQQTGHTGNRFEKVVLQG